LTDIVYPNNPEIIKLLVDNMSKKGRLKCKSWRFLGFLDGRNKDRREFFEKIRTGITGVTPLMEAAGKLDYSEIKRLIKLDLCDINAKNSEGYTALHYAARGSLYEDDNKDLRLICCKYLIKHGVKEDFDNSSLDIIYKLTDSRIGNVLYKNMGFLAKIRYKKHLFLDSK
jgi:ankyrin repeat protein